MKREVLMSQQGIEIRFTGWKLDQSDLDVFEQAVHLARQHPLGTRCHFTGYGFLKSLGRPTGGDHHEWLKDALARLTSATVEITHRQFSYFGPLVYEGTRDESDDQHRYVLEINPKIMALYSAGWTAVDWETRQKLRRKPLALWLHGFYSSHAAPHPLKVETIHRLCGSRNKDIGGFKRDLGNAFKQLVKAEAIKHFEFKDELVFVDNIPSISQQRHLDRPKDG